MTSLSIIIVNYKTPQLLADCLRSIYQETKDIKFEVIVVDNNSRDNSRELIDTYFPEVRWIQMDYNAGFARANNAGIRVAEGEAVLLINSDTIVVDQAIARCFKRFMPSPYVACGVQLLNPDNTPQISGNYFVKGYLNNLLPLPVTGAIIKSVGKILGSKKPHIPEAAAQTEVDWINGAFLMVKKTAIDQAGLLDEDFFLYAEEAEWCYRIGKTGKLVIYGDCKVIHLQGESSNATFRSKSQGYYNLYDRKGLQIMLSNFVRLRKQHGKGWYIFQLMVYTGTIPLFLLYAVFSFRGNVYRNLAGFISNLSYLWKITPTILSGRPHFYKVL